MPLGEDTLNDDDVDVVSESKKCGCDYESFSVFVRIYAALCMGFVMMYGSDVVRKCGVCDLFDLER
jgi:hypothetical protein